MQQEVNITALSFTSQVRAIDGVGLPKITWQNKGMYSQYLLY